MNNTRPILVTGAGGFIGSHIVHRLLEDGHSVAVLVKKETDLWRLAAVEKDITKVRASLLDKDALEGELVDLNPAGVFHLAASNIASGVTAGDGNVVNANLLGTKKLIDSLADIEYSFFIQTGSFMEYGPKMHPVREDDMPEPTELYSITKLGATLYANAVARQMDKPLVTLRLFTPYGPYMQMGRLVSEVIRRALAEEPIELSDRSITRDFIFIDDVVDLCMEMMSAAKRFPGEIFNCGSGRAVRMEDFINMVCELTHTTSDVRWGARPVLKYDAALWQADMSKVHQHVGWRPRYSLSEGIQETIAWIEGKTFKT